MKNKKFRSIFMVVLVVVMVFSVGSVAMAAEQSKIQSAIEFQLPTTTDANYEKALAQRVALLESIDLPEGETIGITTVAEGRALGLSDADLAHLAECEKINAASDQKLEKILSAEKVTNEIVTMAASVSTKVTNFYTNRNGVSVHSVEFRNHYNITASSGTPKFKFNHKSRTIGFKNGFTGSASTVKNDNFNYNNKITINGYSTRYTYLYCAASTGNVTLTYW
ncbi:hypothetical protein LJC56_06370 [Christensenellaceae bacterium OttesenSCG-928-K19]|nr:hypothetical protein [Christensenellaceae bacterium OttesenSCG-928-K19]